MYGLLSPSVKKSVLRHMYKDLVGDETAAATCATSQETVLNMSMLSLNLKYLISSTILEKHTLVGVQNLICFGPRPRSS